MASKPGGLMNHSPGVAQTSVLFSTVGPSDDFIAHQPFHRNTVAVGDARDLNEIAFE